MPTGAAPLLMLGNAKLQEYRDLDPKNKRSALHVHFQHTQQRIKERYGFHINEHDWERLNWMVFKETDACKLIYVKSDECTVYDVVFSPKAGRDRTIRVYFHEYLFCVTTSVPISDFAPASKWSEGYGNRRRLRWEHGMQQAAIQEAAVSGSSPFSVLAQPEPKEIPMPKTANIVEAFPEPPKMFVTEKVVPVAPAPETTNLIITVGNAAEIAKKIWDSFEGNTFATKGSVAKALIEAIKGEHKARRATFKAPANLVERRHDFDEEAYADKIVGKTLTQLTISRVPILGIPMLIRDVFTITNIENHPMAKGCTEFLQRNRLILRSAVRAGSGKAVTFVDQTPI